MFEKLFPSTVVSLRFTMRQAVCVAAAAIAAIVGFGFLIGFLAIFLSERFGPAEAALILAGGFFVIALLLYAVSRAIAARRTRVTRDLAAKSGSNVVARVSESVGLLGFPRQAIALRAAAALSQTMKPLHLVGASIVGGFLFGRRMRR